MPAGPANRETCMAPPCKNTKIPGNHVVTYIKQEEDEHRKYILRQEETVISVCPPPTLFTNPDLYTF